MRFPKRRNVADAPPGVTLKVHSPRDPASLRDRDLSGCLVVIDHRDLDAETARRLVDGKPFAVLNAAEYLSGRYAALGPEVLARAGVHLLEAERDGILAIADGSTLRLHEGTLYDGAVVVLDVTAVSLEEVTRRMDAARAGLSVQLDSFARSTGEFLRREEDLLLHGVGLPRLRTRMVGRPVVVVGPAARPADLKAVRGYLRDAAPVVVAVDAGAEAAVARGLRPDVVVLSAAGTVQPRTLGRCREVVLSNPGDTARRRAEQANVPTHEVPTGLSGLDLGLLLAHEAGAKVVVPVGYPGSLEDFVDRGRDVQVSNVLTRLKVGSRLVDASAVPALHAGRARGWQVALLLVVAVAVLALTLVATPVGNDWWTDLRDAWGLS